MKIAERSESSSEYKYGFQGQEHDEETGFDNYKYRMHDPRLGRFFAIDPLIDKYPFYSSYSFSGNRIIDATELEGLEPRALDYFVYEMTKYFEAAFTVVTFEGEFGGSSTHKKTKGAVTTSHKTTAKLVLSTSALPKMFKEAREHGKAKFSVLKVEIDTETGIEAKGGNDNNNIAVSKTVLVKQDGAIENKVSLKGATTATRFPSGFEASNTNSSKGTSKTEVKVFAGKENANIHVIATNEQDKKGNNTAGLSLGGELKVKVIETDTYEFEIFTMSKRTLAIPIDE